MVDKYLVVWNLLNEFVQTTSSSYVSSEALIPWDASKFADIDKVYLVMTGGCNNSTGCIPNNTASMIVQLYNTTDSSSITEYTHAGTYPVTEISGDILSSMPNSGAGEKLLTVRVKVSCGLQVTLIDAKLYIVMKAPADGSACKARIIRDVGYASTSASTSYSEVSCKRFLYQSTNYGQGDGSSGVEAVYFGTTYKGSNATYTSFVQLYNLDDLNEVVAHSKNSTSYSYAKSADLGINFITDGYTATTKIKTSNALNTTTIKNAHIIIDCNDISVIETDFLIGNMFNINISWYTTNSFATSNRAFTTYKDYSVGVTKTLYGEACAVKSLGADTGSIRLTDDGSSMTNSQYDFNSTSFSRDGGLLGSTLTEPGDGSKIDQNGKGYTTTSSNLSVHNYRLIMVVSGIDKATTGGFQLNIGDVWKSVSGVQINIGDTWKTVSGVQINIGDVWKTVF